MAQNITLAQALTSVLALSDADKAVVLATLISLGRAPQVPEQVSAPVAEAKPRKPLEAPKDVTLDITPVSAGKGKVAFTLGFGAGREGAKLRIKDAGFAWDTSLADDKHKGAWVGTTAQAKSLGITAKSTALTITAEWVQKGRDKAAAKAARKNA